MNPTSVEWRGLTLGAGTPYRTTTVEGWEARPAGRYDKQPRAGAHGAHRSPVWADERIVTLEGFCWSATQRDTLLADLQASMVFGDDDQGEPLSITLAGRTLTAGAQLIASAEILARGEWGIGRFGWVAQWRCPDPLRYGAPQTASTALPAPGGGLAYPMYATGALDYGEPGAAGRLVLTNVGTAPAPILFTARGGLEEGFEISASGDRLRYVAEVPAGQEIDLDTSDGSVLVEGTASRRGYLSLADWMLIPARDRQTGTPGTLTVQFTSLGGERDPNALLTALWAETHW